MQWDFSPIERLPARAIGPARLFCGLAAGGPRLLFVHGAFHGAWCWARYAAFFQERRLSFAALDLRGHGGLPQDSAFPEAGIGELAQDVVAAAQALGEVVLVGHSFGAQVALAALEESGAKGLVLLAPVGIGGSCPLPSFAAGAAVAPPPPERARRWFLQGYGGDIAGYEHRLCPESPALLNARGAGAGPTGRPLLCLGGGLDRSPFHPKAQDEAAAAALGAELVTLPHSGHGLMLDDHWQEGARALHGWLARRALIAPL